MRDRPSHEVHLAEAGRRRPTSSPCSPRKVELSRRGRPRPGRPVRTLRSESWRVSATSSASTGRPKRRGHGTYRQLIIRLQDVRRPGRDSLPPPLMSLGVSDRAAGRSRPRGAARPRGSGRTSGHEDGAEAEGLPCSRNHRNSIRVHPAVDRRASRTAGGTADRDDVHAVLAQARIVSTTSSFVSPRPTMIPLPNVGPSPGADESSA